MFWVWREVADAAAEAVKCRLGFRPGPLERHVVVDVAGGG